MVSLVKIATLRDIKKYEQKPQEGLLKHPTKGVPLILKTSDEELIITDHWIYIDHNDELVYNIKKNLWCQGSDYYDKGESHIKEIYVVIA